MGPTESGASQRRDSGLAADIEARIAGLQAHLGAAGEADAAPPAPAPELRQR